MGWDAIIMYAIAAVVGLGGLWLLVQLRRPLTPGRVYAYRMMGIMAVSGAAVLAMSATALWQWSLPVSN